MYYPPPSLKSSLSLLMCSIFEITLSSTLKQTISCIEIQQIGSDLAKYYFISLSVVLKFRTLNIFDPQGRRQLMGFECSLHSEYRQDGGDKGWWESWRRDGTPGFSSNTVQSCGGVWSNPSIFTFEVLLIISLTRVMRKGSTLQLHLSVTRPASTLLLTPLLVLMTWIPLFWWVPRDIRGDTNLRCSWSYSGTLLVSIRSILIWMKPKDEIKNILEARGNRDDKTGCRLPQRD